MRAMTNARECKYEQIWKVAVSHYSIQLTDSKIAYAITDTEGVLKSTQNTQALMAKRAPLTNENARKIACKQRSQDMHCVTHAWVTRSEAESCVHVNTNPMIQSVQSSVQSNTYQHLKLACNYTGLPLWVNTNCYEHITPRTGCDVRT